MRFYSVNDIEFNRFMNYANESEFIKEIDMKDVTTNKTYLKTLLKAQAARFKWGNEWYYRIMNQNDTGVSRAVASLN